MTATARKISSVEELGELVSEFTSRDHAAWTEERAEIDRKAQENVTALEGRIKAVEQFYARTKYMTTPDGLQLDPVVGRPKKDARGLFASRILRAKAGALVEAKNGNRITPAEFASRYLGEKDADGPVLKALSTSDAESAGALLPIEQSSEVIELLREESVVDSFGAPSMDITGGSMRWPKHTGASTGYYIGEEGAITESFQSFGSFQLVGKKVGVLVAVSNDFLRKPMIDLGWFRDEMVYTLRLRQDLAKIRGDGLENTPRGLRYWAPAANLLTDGTAAATASPTLAHIVSVLSQLWLTLRNGTVKFRRPGFIMAPRTEKVIRDAKNADGQFIWRNEMVTRGTIDGIPYRSTIQIPTNLGGGSDTELYLSDFSEFIQGVEYDVDIQLADQASYVDVDSGTVHGFPQDISVLRVLAKHDCGMANPEAVAVQTDVQWTAGP